MTDHASYLAGYRAAKETAARLADDISTMYDRPSIMDAISKVAHEVAALPDPAPPAADPERAARLAEIREWQKQRIRDNEVWRSGFGKADEYIAYLLSLIPPEAPPATRLICPVCRKGNGAWLRCDDPRCCDGRNLIPPEAP